MTGQTPAIDTGRPPANAEPNRLTALAGAIVRTAVAESIEEVAALASQEAAALLGGSGAAVVVWSETERPIAAAIDGRGWGFAGVMDRAIRAAERDAGSNAAVLRVTGFQGAIARPVIATARIVAPGGERGSIVVMGPAGSAVADVVADRVELLAPYAAAVGGTIDQIIRHQVASGPGLDPAQGLVVRDARAERRRIARELHDGLIQSLYGTGLAIRAQATRREIPPQGRATMLGWVDRIDRLIDEARAYVDELERAEDAVAELGVGLDAIAEAASVAGLDVSTEVSATDQVRPSPDVRRELLQVAREAVSNAMRHSKAHRVALRVTLDKAADVAVLVVEDDGQGFDPGIGIQAGHGLRNMAARATALGGELDVVSRRGGGTTIRLRVPLGRRLGSVGSVP